MKKRLLAMLLTGAMALSLTACGGDAAKDANETNTGADMGDTAPADTGADGKVKVGFVVKSLADQYWILMKAGAEATAAELGAEVSFVGPNSESDVQMQVDMIENMLAQGVNALCVAPSSQDAVLPAFEKADQGGVKVIAVDTDTTFEKKISFIGTGNEAAGEISGKYAAEAVGAGAKAVVIRGRMGDKTHDDREAGIVKELEAGGVEIIEVKAADSETEKAMNIMQDMMNRYSDIAVVVCTADSMAQGVQRAVETAGKDIKVVGFDGTIPVCEMTAEGKFLGTVAQSPYRMGQLAVEAAVKAVKGEAVEDRIDSGAEMVTQENAAAFVENLKKLAGEA